jgi:hypothetical protein
MLHLIRAVTGNVSMGSTRPYHRQVQARSKSDLTVHHLSEETVEKSLFILFNDIMIQGTPVTVSDNSSSEEHSSGRRAGITGSGMGSVGGGVGAGSSSTDGVKNLELCRVIQLESRLHPAEFIG